MNDLVLEILVTYYITILIDVKPCIYMLWNGLSSFYIIPYTIKGRTQYRRFQCGLWGRVVLRTKPFLHKCAEVGARTRSLLVTDGSLYSCTRPALHNSLYHLSTKIEQVESISFLVSIWRCWQHHVLGAIMFGHTSFEIHIFYIGCTFISIITHMMASNAR